MSVDNSEGLDIVERLFRPLLALSPAKRFDPDFHRSAERSSPAQVDSQAMTFRGR